MIFKIIVLSLICLTNIAWSDSTIKTLYGEDDRHEPLYYYDRAFVKKTEAVAGLVQTNKLSSTPINAYRTYNFCPGERFSYQPVLTRCSAFLIADDIMLTAGHCIKDQAECDTTSIVFDFYLGSEQIDSPNIYRCVELLDHKLEDNILSKFDYTIFKIDRQTNRTPLKLNLKSKETKNTPVLTIGHPLGLPMKITDNAKIIKSRLSYFVTNLDTFAGNSGSPVFNQKTGDVIGLVSFGQEDWALDINATNGHPCRRAKVKNNNSKDGERIFRLKRIKNLNHYID